MSITDNDLFLIETPGGDSRKIRASKLRDNLASYNNHKLLVNLADYSSRYVLAQNMQERLQDSHWMMVERGGVSYKVSGSEVLDYFPRNTDITSWTWANFTSTDASGWGLNHIAYGQGKFVATTGNTPKLLYSTDGLSWTASPSSIANVDWEGVAYGGGTFVAVSPIRTGNQVMTSPDGINWTARSTPGDVGWNEVAYGNGKFVAVARSSGSADAAKRIMYSEDGISWTQATHSTGANFELWSVTFAQGKFVAVGHTSTSTYGVLTSTDAINWSRVDPANVVTGRWKSVTYGDNTFVVVGQGNSSTPNKVMHSANGDNWTAGDASAVIPGNNYYFVNVAGGSDLFVATNSASSTKPAMSEDGGSTWTSIPNFPSQFTGSGLGVGYGGGKFIVSSLTGVAVSTPA